MFSMRFEKINTIITFLMVTTVSFSVHLLLRLYKRNVSERQLLLKETEEQPDAASGKIRTAEDRGEKKKARAEEMIKKSNQRPGA